MRAGQLVSDEPGLEAVLAAHFGAMRAQVRVAHPLHADEAHQDVLDTAQ